ncbi:MAG: dihydrodipicolinate synthase family protein [Isosphaeraceae bacterium]
MGLDLARLSTVQLVPLTPFSEDGSTVLPDVLGSFARAMYGAGIRVFLPAAGTGEFHSLGVDEAASCVAAVRAAVGPDAVVIAPIGMGLAHALSLGRRAIEAGADALLVMPPIHSYLSDAGLRDYFRTLMDALPLPFLAYKKGPAPSDELLGELGASGRLVGVKYAVNDVDAVTRFCAANAGRLRVYCGTAERFAPFFHLAGANGYTSGAGNLCPRLTLALHAALAKGDYARAMDLQRVLRPIEDFRARAGDSYNISVLKAGIRLTGFDFGPPRPPLRRLAAAEEVEISAMLGPILAKEAELAG